MNAGWRTLLKSIGYLSFLGGFFWLTVSADLNPDVPAVLPGVLLMAGGLAIWRVGADWESPTKRRRDDARLKAERERRENPPSLEEVFGLNPGQRMFAREPWTYLTPSKLSDRYPYTEYEIDEAFWHQEQEGEPFVAWIVGRPKDGARRALDPSKLITPEKEAEIRAAWDVEAAKPSRQGGLNAPGALLLHICCTRGLHEPLREKEEGRKRALTCSFARAGDQIRTGDPHLGKVMLYH